MGKSKTPALALLFAAAALAAAALAPAPARAVCNMSTEQIMSCQPAAASTTEPAEKPSDACCAALAGADLACLCAYKDSPWLSIYNIDPQRAMALPAQCGLQTPDDC
ncbi:hypothetical protein ACP4OV_030621 [Aristida adscensionis]